MKRPILSMLLSVLLLLPGCAQAPSGSSQEEGLTVLATTYPVYLFARTVAQGVEGVTVERLNTGSVSCLHDYTLSVDDMKKIEGADVIAMNGAGLEDFMEDALRTAKHTITASDGVETLPGEDGEDPHIWLEPTNCIQMCRNIAAGLSDLYPDKQTLIGQNLLAVTAEYAAAQAYGEEALKNLSCRELVTFHDGFSYFARAFRLTIAAAMEIEEGSEPSAKEIESVIRLVEDENIPAVFCEENGERQTAETVAKQTGTGLFALTMGMDGGAAGCTDAIYHNIDIIREALS